MHKSAPHPDNSQTTRSAPETKPRSSLFVHSTEKAFQVLRAFDGSNRYMTLADVARSTGLDRSATQRLVYTLETLGYLRRIPNTRNYGLTPRVLEFSYNYLRVNELTDKASPYLLDISRTLGETTNLQELDGHEIVFVARFPGRHLVNVDIVVGSRLPAFFTASGTAILSRLPEQQRLEILSRTQLNPITPHTEVNPERLMQRVQEVAGKGYAIIADETVLGDISVAAPIINYQGLAVAAINISVPTTRWTLARAEAELAPHVQMAASAISKSKFAYYSQ